MRKILKSVIFLCLISLSANSLALEIVIDKGKDSVQSIIVVPFVDDSTKAKLNMARVISDDLELSGKFKPVDNDLFPTNPNNSEEINFSDWQGLGSSFMVLGKISQEADSFKLLVELVDIYEQTIIAKYSSVLTKTDAQDIRKVGHKISDLIYEKLTGERGAFSTRLAYVSVKVDNVGKKTYALEISGVDGKDAVTAFQSHKSIFSPAWSADGKSISFVSLENDKTQIWQLNLINLKRTKLADFKGNNSAPAWSPDGSVMAASLSRDGNPEIYMLSTDGLLRRVTNHSAADTEPTWAPDGKSVYFLSDRSGSPQIYQKVLPDGQVKIVSIFGTYNASPDVSADGQQLALLHKTDLGYQIAVQNLADQTLQVVSNTYSDESPSFAPNGQMLVYATNKSGNGVLTITDLAGTVYTEYSSTIKSIREPTWSPYLD